MNDDVQELKNNFPLVNKYLSFDTMTMVIIGSNRANCTPPQAITELNKIAKEHELSNQQKYDILFFIYYFSHIE